MDDDISTEAVCWFTFYGGGGIGNICVFFSLQKHVLSNSFFIVHGTWKLTLQSSQVTCLAV